MRFKIVFAATVLLVARVVQAADPQPYTVHMVSTGNGSLNATLRASSQLDSLRTTAPVSPFALVDRAQQDIGRLQSVLDSFGYYRANVSITVDGRTLDDPDLPGTLTALPKGKDARVEVRISTGALFHLRKVSVEGMVNAAALSAMALKSGAPAVAADVLAARERLLNALEEQGHAYATVSEPVAYENATLPVLDVTFMAEPGAIYHLGSIRIEGLKHVGQAFIQRQLLVHPGELYSPGSIERARTSLLALGVFASVTARLPPRSEVNGTTVPLVFAIVERARHAVSLNAAYSSDLGASAGATWTDRNLFGDAEQLAVNASMINLGGTASNGLGYDTGARLTKPDFFKPDQSLQFSLVALRQYLQAYDQTSATGGVMLSRQFSARWNASIGVTLEQEEIVQPDVCLDSALPGCSPLKHYTLLAVPVSARYDNTGLANPLDDPLHGVRVSLSITPTASYGNCEDPSDVTCQGPAAAKRNATFEILEANASTYFDFAHLGWSRTGRSVLALRLFAAQARGAGQYSLPPDQRFYGGGSATVRGFRYQSIGPQFPDGDPIGGTALVSGSVELRERLWNNFGMAAFVDAGEVTSRALPFEGPRSTGYCSGVAYQEPLSIGYGVGLRYYTPVGPIRVDVALPGERPPCGDAFEAYVGLGQAF